MWRWWWWWCNDDDDGDHDGDDDDTDDDDDDDDDGDDDGDDDSDDDDDDCDDDNDGDVCDNVTMMMTVMMMMMMMTMVMTMADDSNDDGDDDSDDHDDDDDYCDDVDDDGCWCWWRRRRWWCQSWLSTTKLPTLLTSSVPEPSAGPVIIHAVNTSSSSLLIAWKPIPPQLVHGILLGYHVAYNIRDMKNTTSARGVQEANASTPSVLIQGLRKFTPYRVEVSGFTLKGAGPYSRSWDVVTDEDGEAGG